MALCPQLTGPVDGDDEAVDGFALRGRGGGRSGGSTGAEELQEKEAPTVGRHVIDVAGGGWFKKTIT